jgi:hypothetical protein
MRETDLFLLFIQPLNRAGVRYVIGIRGMLNISGKQLNQADLQEWIKRRGVEAEWRKVTT